MSQFLRDETFKNLTIEETALQRFNEEIMTVTEKYNTPLKSQFPDTKDQLMKALICTYTIRFDGKGFIFYDFKEVMKCFTDARNVEWVIFSVEPFENKNKPIGKKIELKFQSAGDGNCYLCVQDDDSDWVDCVFTRLKERLARHKNKNWIFRNEWTATSIQILGVLAGFFFSLLCALKIAPYLKIDNAQLFCFIAVFLIFSNLWTLIIRWIGWAINKWWPNISFKKPRLMHWLLQGIIATVIAGASIFVVGKLNGLLSRMLTHILK